MGVGILIGSAVVIAIAAVVFWYDWSHPLPPGRF
jgi:hypothetical protein